MIMHFVTKSLKQTFRDKALLAIIIFLPVGFFTFFSFVFTNSSVGPTSFMVGYVNQDIGYNADFEGIIPNNYLVSNNRSSFGDLYLDLLENHLEVLYETNITLELVEYDTIAAMREKIQTSSITMGISIPANLTEAILGHYNLAYRQNMGRYYDGFPLTGNSSITLLGDPSLSRYYSASAIVEGSFNTYIENIYGIEVFSSTSEVNGAYLSFQSEGVDTSQNSDGWNEFVSGLLVFAVILQMMNVGNKLAAEREEGTINRIKLSLSPNHNVLIGIMVTQIIIVGLQLLISILVLSLWGTELSFYQWVRIFIVLQIANFNVSGLAMMVSAFARSKNEATTINSIASAPIGFLSGAFLPVPDVYVIESIGLLIWDIIPTYHANTAVSAIIVDNAMWAEIFKSLAFLTFFAVIWFAAGVWIYYRQVIKADS